MDALWACAYVYAGVCFATWLLSVLTGEYSWVDRICSLVPIAYTGIFAGAAGFADARLDVMSGPRRDVGAALTFNFAQGGLRPWRRRLPLGGNWRSRMTPWQFSCSTCFIITLYGTRSCC